MLRPRCFARDVVIVVALVIAVVVTVTGGTVAATKGPSSAPLRLVGVFGTPLVFVVSSYAVGCPVASCLRLQVTSDNGGHFSTLHPPPISPEPYDPLGNLVDLAFANREDGYALLNSPDHRLFYVTVNGAQSWHRVVVAPGFSIVQLSASRGVLYTVIARCSPSGCTNYHLGRSGLAARHWTTSTMPAVGLSIATYGPLVWGSTQPSSVALLYTSHDRGRTFTRSSERPLASANGCGLTATSATSIWAECSGGMLVDLVYSGDAGVHWVGIPTIYSGTGGGAFDPVSGSLAYVDVGQVTRSKNLYRINDQGRSVTAVGSLVCANANGLVFTDARHGLAACDRFGTVSSTELLATSDGGSTWTLVHPY